MQSSKTGRDLPIFKDRRTGKEQARTRLDNAAHVLQTNPAIDLNYNLSLLSSYQGMTYLDASPETISTSIRDVTARVDPGGETEPVQCPWLYVVSDPEDRGDQARGGSGGRLSTMVPGTV